ncbi:MAG: hypothetical protein CL670_07170 [Balneola sp.]|nr:hypothetical protein [Balneola sp.]MBE78915.1 hypothetical protein [Balneola sp.]HBX67219.1 hypothetical protein [Balneolaceae bacterium]|tara:strand:- start:2615 stop:3460 length:846 start_codon:yes stop_codon:yes gene_type:complete
MNPRIGLVCILLAGFLYSCQKKEDRPELKVFTIQPVSKVMIVGSYHFAQESETDELSEENQLEIDKILDALEKFCPTKVVIEKEAQFKDHFNEIYTDYRAGSFSIDTLANETYQLGFKMAHRMNHGSIYLFDNKPEFIGSLEGFTFSKFNEYAAKNDSAFARKHIDQIISAFSYNDSLKKTLPLYKRIKLLNSPEAQQQNTYRMHMYELRAGIGDNWMGPDWLGRWYQRNIRMMGNLLKISETGDRLLVIVGDNHKWILEDLIDNTPELKTVSTYKYLMDE